MRPELIVISNLVELQVAFMAVRLARAEYIFLPKLRAICVLSREVERVRSLHCIQQYLLNNLPFTY